MDGYIRLYRKVLENSIFQNANLLKVFIWCLLKATYKTREALVGLRTITLEPGQFIYGRHKAADELKIKPSTLNDYIQTLRMLKIIDIKSNNKFSIVTLINWEVYQSYEDETDSKTDNKPTAKQQQTNTNNKVKKDKNIYSSSFEEFWNMYPRKVGKGEAFAQWKARIKDGIADSDLIKAARNYADECQRKGTEPQYIKHPRTFLNSKKPFEDYIEYQVQTERIPKESSQYRDLSNYEPGGDN